jgi:hypothetical protein
MRFLAITHKEAITLAIVSSGGQSFTSLTYSLPWLGGDLSFDRRGGAQK